MTVRCFIRQPDSPSTEKVKTVTSTINSRARCRQAWKLCHCSPRQTPQKKPPRLLHLHHLRVANSRARLPRTSRTWCKRKKRVCRRRRQDTAAPTKTISRSQGNGRVRGWQAQLGGIWFLRRTWHHSGKSWLGRPVGRCKCLHVPRSPRGRAHSAAGRCVAPLLFCEPLFAGSGAVLTCCKGAGFQYRRALKNSGRPLHTHRLHEQCVCACL
jgi:hypothetical protein